MMTLPNFQEFSRKAAEHNCSAQKVYTKTIRIHQTQLMYLYNERKSANRKGPNPRGGRKVGVIKRAIGSESGNTN